METTLEKTKAIAEEAIKKITPPVDSKAESKGAASEEGKEKTEGTLEEVKAKAAEEAKILTTDDKDLSDEEKARKVEILKVKEEKLSPEDKIKRVQEASQRRIDELTSKLKDSEYKSSEQIKKFEAELVKLKESVQPRVEEDANAKLLKAEQDRIKKIVEEDKEKPHEDRREMSDDELEAWYLEDPVKATRWIQKNEIRRVEDRKKIEDEEKAKVNGKKQADEFVSKQKAGLNKLFSKYPQLNPSQEFLDEHKGKSLQEMDSLLCQKSEHYKFCVELVQTDPKKYLESAEGPELVLEAMDKHFSKPKDQKPEGKKVLTLTEEELEARIQAEAERRANLDEGITSTKGRKMEKEEVKSNLRQRQELIARKAKISPEQLEASLARRKTIPGAGTFTVEGE